MRGEGLGAAQAGRLGSGDPGGGFVGEAASGQDLTGTVQIVHGGSYPLLLTSILFPASGSFLMSQLFASGGQSIGTSVSFLPINIQD